jgi:TetR/AcrR family transcriptional regulator, ethionamide resistance regulator
VISGGQKATTRREQRREALVRRLLPSVEALLAEGESYTDLSVDDLIERAEVPRSTFYYHFRDKGELLIAISADAVNEIVTVSEGLYEPGLHRSRMQFEQAVRRTVLTWLSHVPLMNALSELAAYNPAVKEQFLAGWHKAQQRVAEHIRDGQEEGFVRADLHPEYVGGWLTWMAERGISMVAWPAPQEHLDQIAGALAATVWHTLYEPQPKERQPS